MTFLSRRSYIFSIIFAQSSLFRIYHFFTQSFLSMFMCSGSLFAIVTCLVPFCRFVVVVMYFYCTFNTTFLTSEHLPISLIISPVISSALCNISTLEAYEHESRIVGSLKLIQLVANKDIHTHIYT